MFPFLQDVQVFPHLLPCLTLPLLVPGSTGGVLPPGAAQETTQTLAEHPPPLNCRPLSGCPALQLLLVALSRWDQPRPRR